MHEGCACQAGRGGREEGTRAGLGEGDGCTHAAVILRNCMRDHVGWGSGMRG